MKKGLLTKSDIQGLISNKKLTIVPLLDPNQIGGISVDLRIGLDFLSQHQGREAFIDTTEDTISNRPIKSHFTETRRKLGENFLLHPSQPVLFSTLEYLKLPNDVFVDLALNFVSLFVLCCHTPIKIMSGARFLQARFYKLNKSVDYFNIKRKYTCQVRPVASKANEDDDLKKLLNLFNS